MFDGKGLRGTLVALGVASLVTAAGLVLLPRLVPASLTAIPQAARGTPTAASVEATPTGPAAAELDPLDAATLAGPRFDTVRVAPDGSGLVAGRTDPGNLVFVLLEQQVVAEETADDQGRFVAFLSLAPSDQPRALSLRDEDGTLSDETVILAPTPPPDPAATVVLASPGEGAGSPQPGTDQMVALDVAKPGPDLPAGPPEPEDAADLRPGPPAMEEPAPDAPPGEADPAGPPPDVSADLTQAASALIGGKAAPSPANSEPSPAIAALDPAILPPQPETTPRPGTLPSAAQAAPDLPGSVLAERAQAPVLVSDSEGVRVLQPALPPGADPETLATVALDAIAYDSSGEVVLTGRASGAGVIRLYIDNAPVADAPIAPDGTWRSTLGNTGPGIYTLRIDQIDTTGSVVSRIETPFQREARDQLAATMAEASKPGQTIAMRTVQPGNTLWAIARDRYGEPLMYVRVFEANRDRIRDADLIYPGQVFVLPATDGR